MEIVSSADYQRYLGRYQDRALVEPILITRNGRGRTVVLSAEEYRRLKQLDRQSLTPSELSAESRAALEAAEMPPVHGPYLDDDSCV